MRTHLVRSTVRKALWLALIIGATACQQHLPDLSAAYQANTQAVLGNFANSVSRSMSQPSGVTARGLYDSTSSPFGLYGSPTLPGYAPAPTAQGFDYYGSQPYGGIIISQALQQDVQDCGAYVQSVPPIPENYLYMVGTLARCLDRILAYENPLLTFAYRNMSPDAQQQYAYLLNFRQPGTLNGFGGQPLSVMNQYATQGYVNQTY